MEKTLKENESKFSAEDRSVVEQAISETREALEKGEAAEIQAASERLEKASHRLAEAMYRDQAAAAGGPGGAGPDQPDAGAGPAAGTDDVIDAEVVENGKVS